MVQISLTTQAWGEIISVTGQIVIYDDLTGNTNDLSPGLCCKANLNHLRYLSVRMGLRYSSATFVLKVFC